MFAPWHRRLKDLDEVRRRHRVVVRRGVEELGGSVAIHLDSSLTPPNHVFLSRNTCPNTLPFSDDGK